MREGGEWEARGRREGGEREARGRREVCGGNSSESAQDDARARLSV
jgi:hypothetical protein